MFAMGTDSGVQTIQFAGPTHSQLRNAAARPLQIRVGCCFSLLSSGNSWTRLSASEFGLDSGARFPSPEKRGIVPGITRFSSIKFSVNTPPFLFWPLHWFPLVVGRIGAQGKGTPENCCRIWRWLAKRLSKEDQLAAAVAFPHEWFRAWPPAPQNPELEQLTWNEFRHTRTHTRNQN